jgi:hypothetical protein
LPGGSPGGFQTPSPCGIRLALSRSGIRLATASGAEWLPGCDITHELLVGVDQALPPGG